MIHKRRKENLNISRFSLILFSSLSIFVLLSILFPSPFFLLFLIFSSLLFLHYFFEISTNPRFFFFFFMRLSNSLEQSIHSLCGLDYVFRKRFFFFFVFSCTGCSWMFFLFFVLIFFSLIEIYYSINTTSFNVIINKCGLI